MRFHLTIDIIPGSGNILPINYQYELSSWIYKVIHNGDPRFAEWLHQKGYADQNKRFRLFTFSNLMIPRREVSGDRLTITSGTAGLIITFMPEEAIRHFIQGLFISSEFRLGDSISQVAFRVSSVECLAEPEFSTRMSFSLLSPLMISKSLPGERYARYLSPDQPDFGERLFGNLAEKWKLYTGLPLPDDVTPAFRLTSPFRKKGISIKCGTPMESKIIGYQFGFCLTGPASLLRLGYYTGFGEKNSMGFGCAAIEEQRR